MIEPVDPLMLGIFHAFESTPQTLPVDRLGLVETVERLGQSVVIAVANTSDRRLHSGFGKALGILDRDILAATVAMVDQAATMNWSLIMDRLL